MPAILNTTRVTPEEFLEMGDASSGYELVDGQLRENPMSTESSRVGGRVSRIVGNFVEEHRLGWDFPQETVFRCFVDDPGRLRKPDGAFISYDTLPKSEYVRDGFCETVPDLVWEVLSPNDTAKGIDLKVDQWLNAGVNSVWVLQPENKTVKVIRADGSMVLLREKDTLTEPILLPGFSVSVARLFEQL